MIRIKKIRNIRMKVLRLRLRIGIRIGPRIAVRNFDTARSSRFA